MHTLGALSLCTLAGAQQGQIRDSNVCWGHRDRDTLMGTEIVTQ